ncbi:MAG: hypothetical protein J3K34DRAFT_427412 [Monoraphidium minutum]|nr:MAG: hypothetical protein J3K34DRAFT_427412 [Monoraphidium minutum]
MMDRLQNALRGRTGAAVKAKALDPQTRACVLDFHLYVRKFVFVHPLLRHQLRFINLVTGTQEGPPKGYWERVAVESGAKRLVERTPDAALEIKARTAMHTARMAKLQEEQAAVQAELNAVLAAERAGGLADGAHLADSQDLVQALEAVLFAQLTLENVVVAGVRHLFPVDTILRIQVASKPWWPDWVSIMLGWGEANLEA